MDRYVRPIALIREFGYAVSLHHPGGGLSISRAVLPVPAAPYTELHAVRLADPTEQHIVRVESQGENAEYKAAVELLRMITEQKK